MPPDYCEKYDLPAASCGHCTGAEARARAEEQADGERAPSGPGPWFTARYEGTCADCGEDIAPGDRIRSDGGSRYVCGECGGEAP